MKWEHEARQFEVKKRRSWAIAFGDHLIIIIMLSRLACLGRKAFADLVSGYEAITTHFLRHFPQTSWLFQQDDWRCNIKQSFAWISHDPSHHLDWDKEKSSCDCGTWSHDKTTVIYTANSFIRRRDLICHVRAPPNRTKVIISVRTLSLSLLGCIFLSGNNHVNINRQRKQEKEDHMNHVRYSLLH